MMTQRRRKKRKPKPLPPEVQEALRRARVKHERPQLQQHIVDLDIGPLSHGGQMAPR
jgi:hypothetical protein